MKVIAINGSARKDGNTAILLKRVLKVLEAEGFETELIQLAVNNSTDVMPAEAAMTQKTNDA